MSDSEVSSASDRLRALAKVFEEAGDWSSADVALEWAARAEVVSDDMGPRITAAILGTELP